MRDEERAFPLGAMSSGAILIILAATFMLYPIDFSEILDYFVSLGVHHGFVKPPLAFFDPVIFFFNAVGVWSLGLSGLRIVFERSARKTLGDLTGAFFSFFIAFILTYCASDIFTWQTTLAYFIIGIGILVIVQGIIYYAFPERGKY